jgi:hypothetical protein
VITFLVSGLWHGASWCFVLWGGLHGVYMAASVLSSRWRRKLAARIGVDRFPWFRSIQIGLTFHLVCLAWVFFRAATLDDACYVLYTSALDLPATFGAVLRGEQLEQLLWLGRGRNECLLAVSLIVFMAIAGFCRRRIAASSASPTLVSALASSPWLRTAIAAAMLYFLAFHGAAAQSFVYAQF